MPKQQTTYSWRGRSWGVDPAVAVKELERIRRATGSLTSEAVVAEATPEDAPLHPAFEWDDEAASHAFRLMQARGLVRSASVSVKGAEPRAVFVHVQRLDAREGRYEPMDLVVERPDQFALALAELERKIDSAVRAVEELRDLASVGKDRDQAARVAVALEAFRLAQEAVRSIH
jgi:hypothetical protein